MRYIFIFIVCAFITGCAPAYYRPYGNHLGYSDFTEGNRIEVTYVGPEQFTLTDAKKYAYIRVAEVAESRRFNYFIVQNAQTLQEKEKRLISGGTTIHQVEDSLGNKNVSIHTRPDIEKIIKYPAITIQCDLSNDSTAGSVSVREILELAQREGIIRTKP